MSPQWKRLDLKSEHRSEAPSAGPAAHMRTLRVLVSASHVTCVLLHSTLLLEAGPESPRPDLPVAKSSLVTSIPRPQVLAVFQPQLVLAHGFGCVAPGCARNCLAAFQATLSMGLGGDLG